MTRVPNEIERPGDQLFTTGGDPSAKLTHGMRQLADWRLWFRDNRDFIRRYFPFGAKAAKQGLTDPERILVIGRRAGVGERDRLRYDQLARDAQIRIITFDRLVDHLSWPTFKDRDRPLRTVRFVDGNIHETEPIFQMTVKVQWSAAAVRDGKQRPILTPQARSSRR